MVSGAIAPPFFTALLIRSAPRSKVIISISYASASTSNAEFRLNKSQVNKINSNQEKKFK